MLRRLACIGVLILCASTLRSNAQTAPPKTKPAPSAAAQTGTATSKPQTLESRVEAYLRNLYAWDSSYQLKIGPAKPSPISDLLEVPVSVSMGDQSDTATVYVSKDGNFIFRGELSDMRVDPFAETRAKLKTEGAPSIGPENAKITMVEFGDLECPSCRQLDLILRELLPQHPEVRLVFKQYPLTEIHPWAMTAAIATQCAFEQSPAAFWKLHDAIYDAQDTINPSNVWDKLQEMAKQTNLNMETYNSCIINPETSSKIQKSIDEGHSVSVTATPTTFVNGRRIVGPDKPQFERSLR